MGSRSTCSAQALRWTERWRSAIKALFGARRILGLEYALQSGLSGEALADQLRRIGVDAAALTDGEPALYPENACQASTSALAPLLIQESLDYGLICSETAFVAVRQEAGQRVETRLIVPNAKPAEWSDTFLSTAQSFGAAPGGVGRGGMLRSMAAPMSSSAVQAMPAMAGAAGLRRHRDRGEASSTREIEVFAGVPALRGDEAVLADASGDPFPEEAHLTRISVEVSAGDRSRISSGLTLLLFVGDMAQPRARIRLADLIRLGGSRPLNVLKSRGENVRIVLRDPDGAWAREAPHLSVTLHMA